MWVAVLVLALAVNLEPTRIGLVAYLLSRPRPAVLLLAFLGGALVMTTSVGLLVLFVLHHGLFSNTNVSGAKVQIAAGMVAVLVAALLATDVGADRLPRKRPSRVAVGDDPGLVDRPPEPPTRLAKLSTGARGLLRDGSPWLSGALGISVGLPSIDYMAVLAVIAASGATPLTQFAALATFLIVAHTVATVPLVSYLVAPDQTRAVIDGVHRWVRSRRRRDFAMLVGVAGCVMIAVGIRGL